jgi:hypothetical protein
MKTFHNSMEEIKAAFLRQEEKNHKLLRDYNRALKEIEELKTEKDELLKVQITPNSTSQREIIRELLTRFQVPRSCAGDYFGMFADRILNALKINGHECVTHPDDLCCIYCGKRRE